MLHHLLPEVRVGHQHGPIVGDPVDGDGLELLHLQLVRHDQHVWGIVKIYLISEHFTTFLHESG